MKRLIKFLVRPAYRKYQDLLFRVSNLENTVDYLINSPKYVESDEFGFNGQSVRKIIFRDILSAFNFEAILETGTWVGNTSGYMAKTSNLPVYTCELNERFLSIARIRLQDIKNIHFESGDSREFLRKMSNTEISKKIVFIYLDAHWYEDLPLEEEIEIVCNTWKDFVIMIDDFQVPGDTGYRYDNYGKNKSLSMETFHNVFNRHNLIPFFPCVSSNDETGDKRGCVVLARKGPASEKLSNLKSLHISGF